MDTVWTGFIFRTPPTGTGPITFRALVKQGETNKGAFYWPSTVDTGYAGPALTLAFTLALLAFSWP